MTKTIAIAYHSGYGHTEQVAKAVAEGVNKESGAKAVLLKVEGISEEGWNQLDAADAIVFGTPTYMGGPSAQFKTFADASSKKWASQKWKNKIAAGFTNSGSYSGDKLATLQQLNILAMQQGMIWASLGLLPPQFGKDELPEVDKINRMGSFIGLMTQSNHASGPDVAPGKGDLETARIFGKRIAEITKRFSN